MKMNHREKLLDIFNQISLLKLDNIKINKSIKNYILLISSKSYTQKAVFTVLTALLVHKILNPTQDIRYHRKELKNGFSCRTIDSKYITPTLKELKLPSMAESGYLTRSMEQSHPYTLDYPGQIRIKEVKEAFLKIVDYLQKNPKDCENILKYLLFSVINESKKQTIDIVKLKQPEKLQINTIIKLLSKQFFYNYHTFNGAKLPVLAFYAIYKSLILDIKRYENCSLKELGYHTTCDTTSNSAGDIEIFSPDKKLFEALEIKFEKEIDINMVRIAKEKIIKHNPYRYYILSTKEIKIEDKTGIEDIINEIRETHGCQLILNGIIPSLKYYLRLISSLESFIKNYSDLISIDKELKIQHKELWNKILIDENCK